MSKSLFALMVVVLLVLMAWSASHVFPLGLSAPSRPPSSLTVEYQTPWGMRREITMGDQTQIEMNANTDVRLTEEGSVRRINLVHGEVSLNVTHDPKRPFVVCAGGFLFRDLGTTFNVVGKRDSVVLTVLEGEVSLEGICGDDGRLIPPGGPTPARVVDSDGRFIGRKLVANDQMTIVTSPDGIGVRTRTLSSAEMSFVTSWREGVLKFDGANLRDAIDGVNRNCGVDIELGDSRLGADANLHGTLKLGKPTTVDGFLKAVKEIYGLVPAPADPLRPQVVTLVKERRHRLR